MYKILSRVFDKLERGLSPRDKVVLVATLLVISVLSIILAVRYYTYIQKSPEFCNSCHLMEEAFTAWKLSGHRHIVCQDCHQLGLLEQNRLLVKFVFTTDRRTPEPHGEETPWKACTRCHWEEASQGAAPAHAISVTKSIGHNRHVFQEHLACKDCHSRAIHAFRPDKTSCLRCHEDRSLHGLGMEEVSCITCHAFAPGKAGSFLPDRNRCLSCHRKYSRAAFPDKVPMARMNCYECHKPHVRIKPTDDDCLRCHTREVLMRKKSHQGQKTCTACHRPHTWTAQ